MHFRISLLTQTCALALGVTLIQGCDSSERFTSPPVAGQSSGDTEFVGQVAPNNGGDNTDGGTGSSGGGTGSEGGTDGDGDGDNGDGDGNGGDGDGDNGDGGGTDGDGDGDNGGGDGTNGDGDGDNGGGGGTDGDGDGDNGGGGTNGDGDGDDGGGGGTDGDGVDNGGSLGPSSSALALNALNYTAAQANLARFAHALTLGSYSTGTSYACAGGGSAILNSGQPAPTWNFSNCMLPSATAGLNVTYNGQLSTSCDGTARTGIENAIYCDVVFNQFQSRLGDQTSTYNGTYSTISESESLTANAAGFSTQSGDDTWTSQSQTIASEASELRGLNIDLDTNKDRLALTIQGHDGYRQASNGCLIAGLFQIKDSNSDAEIAVAAAVGGNMIVDDGISSSTIACSELSPMPYTSPQLN